jgi:clan AA aspartic protease
VKRNVSGLQAVFSEHECFHQDGRLQVEFRVANLITSESAGAKATLDTGFEGHLMLDTAAYRALRLELSEKPESQFPVFRTFGGTVKFRSSLAVVAIAGKELMTEVLCPLYGDGKILIGREMIKDFTTLLHKSERLCIGQATLRRVEH